MREMVEQFLQGRSGGRSSAAVSIDTLPDGILALKSYDTPIAFYRLGGAVTVTTRKHSVTTSRHVNTVKTVAKLNHIPIEEKDF